MRFLLFQIQRLITLPVRIFTSPTELVGSMWEDSGRGRALLLGLPAVLFAVVGVGILLWANYGIADSLEDRYLAKLERMKDQKVELVDDMRREAMIIKATQTTGVKNTPLNELIPSDDPRRNELKLINGREKVYLEKLNDLNPKESDYLFQLANAALSSGDQPRGIALMRMIAPIDKPGYVKGHIWWAKTLLNAPVKNEQQANRNIESAYAHAEQALNREKDNPEAMQIKAGILVGKNQDLQEAYRLYRKLFEDDPNFYVPLLKINAQSNNTGRNEAVLDSAIRRFESKLSGASGSELDAPAKIQTWRNLVQCYLKQEKFQVAEEKLLAEIQQQVGTEGEVWASRMLSSLYVEWAKSIGRSDPANSQRMLDLVKEAHRYYAENTSALILLTILGFNEDQNIAAAAREVYDGTKDPEAPPKVLNRIGSNALGNGDYDSALKYFEMARKGNRRDPEILNNLAYTYIVGNNPNPKRGLALIDEAIRRLRLPPAERDEYLAHFRETRGQALMRLDRWTEAAADLELALRLRESIARKDSSKKYDNRKVLEALIQCYQTSGLDATPYIERLEFAKRQSGRGSQADNSQQGQ